MGWVDIETALYGEWANIAGPRLDLGIGLAAAAAAIWLLLNWRYSGVVNSLRARLKLAEERYSRFEQEFPGKTPAQAAARLRQLEGYLASLSPRRLTAEQKRMIAGAGSPPPTASRVAIVHDSVSTEVAVYARDFVEAFSATPGWNVIEESYPMTPLPIGVGVAVGLGDHGNPSPTEALVMLALRDAGVGHDLLPRATPAADVEIMVSSR
jgi:hypothetical protein